MGVLRRAVALLAAVAVVSGSASARAADDDPWLGRDKALHFSFSIVLGASGYAGASLVFDRMWQRALAGAAFSLSIGAGKELWDERRGGGASERDFAADVAGTAVGIGIALLLDALDDEPEPPVRSERNGARAHRLPSGHF